MLERLRLALIRRLEKLTGQQAESSMTTTSPVDGEVLRKQGNSLLAQGQFEAAESCFRQGLSVRPNDSSLLICLGYALKEQMKFAEARLVLRRVANLGAANSESYEAHYLLAEISEIQEDADDAQRHLELALELKPDFTRACADLVRILRKTKRDSSVRTLLARCVLLCPQSIDYRLWLAEVCADQMDYAATVEQLEAIIQMGAGNARIHVTIGAALCRLDRGDEALRHFNSAVEADPAVAYEVYYHRGYLQSRIGHSGQAITLFEKSIELKSDYLASHQMLLFNLCFTDNLPRDRYREAALRFNRTVRPAQQYDHTIPTKDPKGVLRIGFSCGEFRNHPVYHFLSGILDQIDRSRFQLIAYSNNEINDSLTEAFKQRMDAWQVIRDLSDDAAAELIHSDRIDILIDLCGHSGEARLPVFTRRPAPVQVTWLGYFASTGLDEMDFIIADPVCVPKDSTEWFSETVFYVPSTRLCMARPQPNREIAVKPPPALARGFVTFGSFQQAAKITPKVLRVWSKVLAAVPLSRLRIQSSAFGSEAVCQRVRADMQACGISLDRVDLLGSLAFEDYLEAHSEVDMLIDTFPYTGGTTTAFAFWMGVPVISLLGDTMLSRQGATMLDCVGLSDWVAACEADYVDKAVKFASDAQKLANLRATLRETAEKSPLFDSIRFTQNFEAALTTMYNQRMSGMHVPPDAGAVLMAAGEPAS